MDSISHPSPHGYSSPGWYCPINVGCQASTFTGTIFIGLLYGTTGNQTCDLSDTVPLNPDTEGQQLLFIILYFLMI